MNPLPRLYAIADRTFGDPVQIAKALFHGGAQLVQVRDKNASARQLLFETEEILKAASKAARVIVNDRADVARLVNADGVHVGQDDLPPPLVRSILSDEQWIGFSTHSLAQALEADRMAVTYIAVGPVFATTTKVNPAPVLGLDSLREICSRVAKPVVAIGGITLETAPEVLECGAASVAAIGDLLNHGDVAARTQEWVRRLDSWS